MFEMASSSGKRGQTIQSTERNIIACVIKCCDEEAEQKFLTVPLNKATARAARYCNTSLKTVQRIRNELKRSPEGAVLPTPGATRKRPDFRNAVVDEFDRRVIRDVVEDFYLRQHKVPTCKMLLPVLQEKINFKWQDTTLRRILKEMGYQWKKFGPKKQVLLEKENIVDARCEYLQKIRQFKQDCRPIFYLDDTWVDTNLTFRKCWQNKKSVKEGTNADESEKVHIVHIGGSNGFLDGCELVYTTAYRQGQLTWEMFETWVRYKVIPCLKTPSVIVVHNICFQEKTVDKPPSKSSSKNETIDYLRSHGIPCEQTMRKFTLMSLVDNTTDKEKLVNHFETMFVIHGHTVVRLPTYMCDLNPMELAWRQLRDCVQSQNMAAGGTISLRRLEESVREGIKCVTNEDWAAYCRYVTGFENSFWEKDASMEDVIEKIISNLGEIKDSSDHENSESDSFNASDNSDLYEEDEDSLCDLDSR